MFDDFIRQHRPAVDAELNRVLQQAQRSARGYGKDYQDALRQLTTLSDRGGKRLRPLLFLLAYKGYGGTNTSAIRIAASIELLHTFLLIHDDIVDRDSTRWNGVNIHGAYFEQYGQHLPAREALHFASAQALLIGDLCFSVAQQVLLDSTFDPSCLVQVQKLLLATTNQVIGGEITEVAYSLRSRWPTDAQIDRIYYTKSASYSFELPLRMAGLLNNVSQSEVKCAKDIAQNIGLAYQLQDDLLGIFGDEAMIGKSVLSDVQEGKRTAVLAFVMRAADPTDRQWLQTVLGSDDITMDVMQRVRRIVDASGARTHFEKRVHTLLTTAEYNVAGSILDASAKQQLRQFIAWIDQRQQ